MKIIRGIGIAVFLAHYWIMMAVLLIVYTAQRIGRWIMRKNDEKQPLSPLRRTHEKVHADMTQVNSFGIPLTECRIMNFKLRMEHMSLHGGSQVRKEIKQIQTPPQLNRSFCSMGCWIVLFLGFCIAKCNTAYQRRSNSLPALLISKGYEVWVPNNRGTWLSTKKQVEDCHVYWSYNFDHLVEYDMPALINGVIEVSKHQKIGFIGHSQGSTQLILALGLHQEIKNKIEFFIGLGTVVSMHALDNHFMLKVMSKFKLLELMRWVGFKSVLVLPRIVTRAMGVLMYNCKVYHNMMLTFVNLLCGTPEINKIDEQLFGVMITHEPGGASISNVLQWVQCFRKGKFHKYDYGKQENLIKYGQQSSPEYCVKHLQSLPFNTYLFRGMKDAVMTLTDFNALVSKFNSEKVTVYEIDDYAHLDYVWSKTAKEDIYNTILSIVDAEFVLSS